MGPKKETTVVKAETVVMDQPRVTLPDTPKFNGEGDNIEKIGHDYAIWKILIADWVRLAKAAGYNLTDELEYCYKKQSLRGSAALAVNDLVTGGGEKVRWEDIIEYLDNMYLHHVNAQTIIATLKNVRQGKNETVVQYSARFNRVHRRLVHLGVSNRDVAAMWFSDGLLPYLRARVNEKLMEDQLLSKYSLSDAAGAIACVTNIAIAREMRGSCPDDDEFDDGWDSEDSVDQQAEADEVEHRNQPDDRRN
jgi:hypothetical protein